MATNFPGTLDSLTNPASTDTLDSPSHSDQHINANDAIEAIEAKLGVDSSAVATSIEYILKNTTSGHDHDGTDSKKLTGLTTTHFASVDASTLTGINATNIASGTLAVARLPFTYTAPTAWSPTYGAGAGTYGSTSTGSSNYTQIGKVVFIDLNFTGTLSGSATDHVSFTLPVTPSTTDLNFIASGHITENSNRKQAYSRWNNAGSNVQLFRYDTGALTNGAVTVSVKGFYIVA